MALTSQSADGRRKGVTGKKKKKKKKCERGASCAFINEYQHQLEFYHDDEKFSAVVERSVSNNFRPFNRTGLGPGVSTSSFAHPSPHVAPSICVEGGTTMSAHLANQALATSKRVVARARSCRAGGVEARCSSVIVLVDDDDKTEVSGMKETSANNHESHSRLKPASSFNRTVVNLCDDDQEEEDGSSAEDVVEIVSPPPRGSSSGKRKYDGLSALGCTTGNGVHASDFCASVGAAKTFRMPSPVGSPSDVAFAGHMPLSHTAVALSQEAILGHAAYFAAANEERRQLSHAIAASNRDVVTRQDEEYKESLRLDREKERIKKENELAQRTLEKQRKIEEAEIQAVRRKKIELARRLKEEPDEGDPNAALVAFRLPPQHNKGERPGRIERRFHADSSADHLHYFLCGSQVLGDVKRWTLREVLNGGREIVFGGGKTLRDLGLAPRGLVIVKNEDI